jgi:hypothetical protein
MAFGSKWNDGMVIVQILIVIFSILAVWFIGRLERWRKWGYIFGMICQIPWAILFVTSKQWIMFISWTFCTYAWWQGIYNFWMRKK